MLNPPDRSTIEFEGVRAVATKIARTAIVGEPTEHLKQWVEMLEKHS